MSQYKTQDQEIISPVTQGLVVPEEVIVAQLDASVEAMLSLNPYQGAGKTYSGEIVDMTYVSTMQQNEILRQTIQRVDEYQQEIKTQVPNYTGTDVFP